MNNQNSKQNIGQHILKLEDYCKYYPNCKKGQLCPKKHPQNDLQANNLKKQLEIQKKNTPCHFYQLNQCNHQDKCPYYHPPKALILQQNVQKLLQQKMLEKQQQKINNPIIQNQIIQPQQQKTFMNSDDGQNQEQKLQFQNQLLGKRPQVSESEEQEEQNLNHKKIKLYDEKTLNTEPIQQINTLQKEDDSNLNLQNIEKLTQIQQPSFLQKEIIVEQIDQTQSINVQKIQSPQLSQKSISKNALNQPLNDFENQNSIADEKKVPDFILQNFIKDQQSKSEYLLQIQKQIEILKQTDHQKLDSPNITSQQIKMNDQISQNLEQENSNQIKDEQQSSKKSEIEAQIEQKIENEKLLKEKLIEEQKRKQIEEEKRKQIEEENRQNQIQIEEENRLKAQQKKQEQQQKFQQEIENLNILASEIEDILGINTQDEDDPFFKIVQQYDKYQKVIHQNVSFEKRAQYIGQYFHNDVHIQNLINEAFKN